MPVDRISFEDFMEEALYGEAGFYRTGGSAGRRNDFLTSAEVGPLFGAVVARYLDSEWTRLGRPSPFTVVEAGAGPGSLARAVLAAAPACRDALRYIAVELAAEQHASHPDDVESTTELPAAIDIGVVIANELLDNLPFRIVVFDDGWREAVVETDRQGGFVERLGPTLRPVPGVLPVRADLGARAPLVDRASAWVDDASGRIGAGTLITFDYMVASTAELAVRPWREWLRTYRDHGSGGHYLAQPGSQDITTEVPIDQLPEPDTIRTQAQWLQLHGIDELVTEGVRYWEAHAAAPDLQAVRMRSRVGESEALLDPHGLGGFAVLEWRRG